MGRWFSAFLSCFLVFIVANHGLAATTTIADFNFDVDGMLPSEHPSIKYTGSDASESTVFSVSNGYLQQQTYKKAGSMTYDWPDEMLDGNTLKSTLGTTIEARLNILDLEATDIAGVSSGYGAFFAAYDGANRYGAFFTPDGIDLRTPSGSVPVEFNHSNGFNTYRITSPENSDDMSLFINGEHKTTVKAVGGGLNGFNWGDGLTQGANGANVDWDYLQVYQEDVPPASSLLFREMRNIDSWFLPQSVEDFLDIPGFDHTALNVGELVYESQFGISPGTYRDARNPMSLTGAVVVPETLRGVVQAHTIDTFRHNSTTVTSDVVEFVEVPIPHALAQEMERVVKTVEGLPYPEVLHGTTGFIFTPSVQKGALGTYSCVGLMEWAAEQVGSLFPDEILLHGDEGFIPDAWETIPIARLVSSDGTEIASTPTHVNTLTPNLLHYVLTHPGELLDVQQIFRAAFDPVDFIITDPLGRKLGHTAELGTLNEIPNAFYSGDGALEEVFIPNALPGDYLVEFFGQGDNVFAAVGSLNDGFIVSERIDIGQSFSATVAVMSVPEPNSTVLCLLAILLTATSRGPLRSQKGTAF